MKALHVIPSISLLRGGPSVAVLEMVAALRQQGVDASILTTNDAGPDLDLSLTQGQWGERQGVPVLSFERWSPPLSTLREFAISLDLNRWLAEHLANFDLLHVHAVFSWTSTTAMLQARQAGVPYVVSTLGQLNNWSLGQSALRKRLYLRLIERKNLASASALHFTTAAELEQAETLGLPTTAWILPLGVHLPAEPFPDAHRFQQPIRFLFLSRIHPKKQLEHLLQALALLQQRLPQAAWQLQIAGAGDAAYLAALKSQAEKLGLAAHCHWLGFLEGEAKWQALRQADWFVLPSASENFGIAAIEALAAGTPVILSPEVAVAAEIAAAGAGLLSSAAVPALAQTLERALQPPPVAMIAAARNLATTAYSWPAIATKLQASYASLLP